jgi:4-hydroxybenzoate polyprenyltransferase
VRALRPRPFVAREAYRWLLWGNVLMAGSAAGWAITAQRESGSVVDRVLVLLAFALAVVFYTRDRLDAREQATDLMNAPTRTVWVRLEQGRLKLWTGFWAGVALLCVAMRPAAIAPLLAGLGFALTYTVRWIPWRGARLAWKQLPALKMPYVALLWTILTVATPAVVQDTLKHPATWRTGAVVFLLVMGQILVNDLRDAAGDARSGTYSLPVAMGERGARAAGLALTGAALPIAFISGSAALGVTALYTAILLTGYRRARDGSWRLLIELQGAVAGALSLL